MKQLELPLDSQEASSTVASEDRPCYLWLKEPWSPATYVDHSTHADDQV